ncbi:MAG TPA: hypothetical protein IAD29_00150 [Candidatus Scatocola faecigallinarum]|nr:hypothetical protein [Candidatus Scatocola faecigallinarum]
MEHKIGEKLTKENYTSAAIWCYKNGATITKQGDDYVIVAIPAPTAAELAAAEIIELKKKLSETDYAVIKIAEGAATPEEYADIIGQRATWRARINELEAELGR